MTIYTRILQQIGSSILISLPNDWIKKNSLGKGNSITVETNIDNTVSIYNNYQDEEIKIEFEYGQENSNQQSKNDGAEQVETKDRLIKILLNKIFGAYLLGYNMINIHSKNQISFEDSESIKRATRKLIGLEIVDENSYNIHLQFLIDAKTLNIEKILSMMNSIITGMFKETIRSLSEGFGRDFKEKN